MRMHDREVRVLSLQELLADLVARSDDNCDHGQQCSMHHCDVAPCLKLRETCCSVGGAAGLGFLHVHGAPALGDPVIAHYARRGVRAPRGGSGWLGRLGIARDDLGWLGVGGMTSIELNWRYSMYLMIS